MRGDPFGISQARNLREMGVSIRKTERQRLKDDRGTEMRKKERVKEPQTEEKKGQYRFNLVIVPAFLSPFKKKRRLPVVSL